MVEIQLPAPVQDGQALNKRKSTRRFDSIALSLAQVSSLLWAGYGVRADGKRTVPSAGGLYPLSLYLLIGQDGVEDVPAGLYHYSPELQDIALLAEGDFREKIAKASARQMWMAQAPLLVLITTRHKVYRPRYGKRGLRYAYIEAGCVAQNLHLQAVDLGLGTVVIGAFKDKRIAELAMLPEGICPILIMPVGVASG